MSDTATQDDQQQDGQHTAGGQQDSRNFARVRDERDEWKTKYENLRTAALDNAARIAGFDTGQFLTRQLVKEFNAANPDGDPTPEALLEFATAQGVQPAAASRGGTTGEAPNLADLLTERQQTGDQIREASTQTAPADIDEQIAEAERSGDVARAIALKNEKFGLGRPTAPASP